MQLASMENVYKKWKEKLGFFVIYQIEPHPEQGIFKNIQQPKNLQERISLARKLKNETKMQIPLLIDEVPRKVSKLYGGAPNMIYIIDPQGKVIYHNRWTDAKEVDEFLGKIFNR
ncbi:hypothetical protein BHF71_00210 [Vulcanibacillus modesticaldus]|uniref:Alkyl hydroperoxide reductase subunit C/ Thiol specific antioxidant domain-containing protein n=1 Tax=Vulcanibacillus modesticaldus TaxID=337097 RepID=A0A1D2YXL6_9BACI|nr:deiodinase-like protein [Vulcanibacillus modesticaldus]OEG00367.1 hypothetical protein BHF71_00210 [Vulcanibacillus modesticaldus]